MKLHYIAAALPIFLCGCSGTHTESVTVSTIESAETSNEAESVEIPFTGTMDVSPDIEDLTPADLLESLDITPSDYFTPGVWTSLNTDDTGNFYIFDEDGIHARMIPMADADGVDFAYSITGSSMTMYVGEEMTPYSATLERTDSGAVVIHMSYLGTQDELTFLAGVSADGFNFYPAARLAKMAEKYYTSQTGTEIAGVEYLIAENDMVVLNLWVKDQNGWRSDVESYTISMFTAHGWSSITYDEIDLSAVNLEQFTEEAAEDDIPDMIEETSQA